MLPCFYLQFRLSNLLRFQENIFMLLLEDIRYIKLTAKQVSMAITLCPLKWEHVLFYTMGLHVGLGLHPDLETHLIVAGKWQ